MFKFLLVVFLSIFSIKSYAQVPELAVYVKGITSFGCNSFVPQVKPVYNYPGGVMIGDLFLVDEEYALNLSKDCLYKPKIVYRTPNSYISLPVEVFALDNNTFLISGFEKVVFNHQIWVRLKARSSNLWVRIDSQDSIVNIKQVYATGVHVVDRVCDAHGFCNSASAEIRQVSYKAGIDNEKNCYPVTYRVDSLIELPGGLYAYTLYLDSGVKSDYKNKLPPSLIVPVEKESGLWSAFYADPRCESYNGALTSVDN